MLQEVPHVWSSRDLWLKAMRLMISKHDPLTVCRTACLGSVVDETNRRPDTFSSSMYSTGFYRQNAAKVQTNDVWSKPL